MFHTFTCCCAYSFVIKKEAGPIIARLYNLFQNESDWFPLENFRLEEKKGQQNYDSHSMMSHTFYRPNSVVFK